MFVKFLFDKLAHLRQFYGTDVDFAIHILSGEVVVPIPDLLKYVDEYASKSASKLPSAHQYGDIINVRFGEGATPIMAEVRGIHFYEGKVKYDLALSLSAGEVTRVYNVDSYFCYKPELAVALPEVEVVGIR